MNGFTYRSTCRLFASFSDKWFSTVKMASLVSYKLPVNPTAVAVTGPSTAALIDQDGQLMMLALDARSGQVVPLQRWLKGPLALESERVDDGHRPSKTLLARNAAACVAMHTDHTVWVTREDMDGWREVISGRGATDVITISPMGGFAALEYPREGIRVVDLFNDMIVTALPGCTCADFPDESTLAYARPLFDRNDPSTPCIGYDVMVQRFFSEIQQGEPTRLRCNEPLEPINMHARSAKKENSNDFCISITLVKVAEGDAISTRVAVLRYLPSGVLKPESERAYRDFVAEAIPLPDASLAVHWPARGGFLLQQASRTYPLATTEPAQRGNVVAWAAEDSLFFMQYT